MVSPRPVLLWVRHQFRLDDHRALAAAAQAGRPVIPVFVWDPPSPPGGRESVPKERPLGAAQRWWLHHALEACDQRLRSIESRLILRAGETKAALTALCRETGADLIFAATAPDPAAAARDRATLEALRTRAIRHQLFDGGLLVNPGTVSRSAGGTYQVFTPFWKALLDGPEPPAPVPAPARLPAPEHWPESAPLRDFKLLPGAPDWAGGLRETWRAGEPAAWERLEDFLEEGLALYPDRRDRMDAAGTSGLSPHLRFGEIGPRALWHRLRRHADENRAARGPAMAFLRELAWREFAYHLLHEHPALAWRPIKTAFESFPWRADRERLRKWQKGRTGYPVVDAAMTQLWLTGWMHNRARMVTGSFLVKHLLQPWQAGEAWFWDTLVDADPANNPFGWQWIAGCGADAAPYFRIFNPVLQGRKFDPDGDYVRRWLPALAGVPAAAIHQPWTLPPIEQAAYGLRIGETYPEPMVEHKAARKRALDALARIKQDG